MLDGWYCRSLANEQASGQQDEPHVDVDDDSGSDESQKNSKPVGDENKTNGAQIDYKSQYRYLKKKLKFLIYENEFFQDALRSNQRRFLKVSRDRAFLLDRLLQYEKPDDTSDSDATESSDDEDATKDAKKRKVDPNANSSGGARGRKRKAPTNGAQLHKSVIVEKTTGTAQEQSNIPQQQQQPIPAPVQSHSHGMTPAEVERHLQSRQTVMELMPEHASATVPTEMFSNEPSLDGEPHEHMMDGSPTHIAAEECVTMEYAN